MDLTGTNRKIKAGCAVVITAVKQGTASRAIDKDSEVVTWETTE